MRSLLRWTFRLAVLALLVLAAIWAKRAMDRPPLVTVETVVRQDIERVLAVTGKLRPRQTVEVRPRQGGRIEEIGFEQGQAVRRGDLLVRVDARTARLDLDRAAAAVAQARGELEQAQREALRVEGLAEAGIVSQSEVETARLAVEVRAREVDQLEEARRSREVTLADYRLTAPLDGWVLERRLDPGQNVDPGSIVLVLASVGDAQIEAEIDEQYLSELQVGMSATAAPLGGEARYALRIESLGRQVRAESGAVSVRFDFVELAPDLPAGLTFDINLDIARHPGAVTVPRDALNDLGSAPYVAVVEGGMVVHRRVDIVDWPAPRVVVRDGLEVWDRVILAPTGLAAGTEVRVDEETQDGSQIEEQPAG